MMQTYSRFFSLPKRFFFLTVLSVGFFFLLMHFANVGLSQNIPQPDALQDDTKQSSDTKNNKTPHWLVGSYYTVQNGIEAKLLLNNKGPRPIEVRPTLYNLSGQTLEITPVIVESNSHRFINLQEWASLGGESFQSGSIKLFHTGKDLVLGAQIYLTDDKQSLVFEEKLAELGKFDSRRQEAVWFQPTNQTETQIILSNTSDTNLSITARLSKRPQETGDANVFQLAAHETKILDLRRDFSDGQQFANSDIVGLSLEHTGTKSALQARVLVKDAGRGYSNFAQFSNPSGGKSNEYQGVGFHIGKIDGNQLEPVVIARNVGAEAANISVEIPYTREDGTSGMVALPTINLQAGEMRSFNLKRITQVSRREQIKIAGIEVKYDTAPGSVIVAAHSADRNNNLVFRVPMWDPLQQKSPTGGYPWRIEETSTTQTYIKNTTDQEQDYVAFLLWENGGEYMIGRKTIAAHKTIEIDVKRLRDEQIPDFRGRTIPLHISNGQLQWTLKRIDNLPDDDQRANLALIGRSEQIDLVNKTSSNYACQNCCESSASGFVTADPFGYKYSSYEFEVGDVIQFYAFEEIWTCYQSPGEPPQVYPRNSNNWRSSNTNIATVTSSGLVTIQDAGEVEIGTDFWVSFSYSNGACPPGPYLTECKDGELPKTDEITKPEAKETNKAELLLPECGTCSNRSRRVSPDVDITVAPMVQKIQYMVNGSWVDVPAGGLGPICNGTSVTFKAIPTSGSWRPNRPVWGGDASGTGPEKTVTFSNSGSRTVSARSGNTVSVNVNVGVVNNNINITWLAPNTTTTGGTGSSTTTAAPFVPEYTACADLGANEWKLRVKKIEGQTNIIINTGGYRNPATQPPVSQIEATDAVNEMNNYYPAGQVQAWHTPAASEAHENYHNTEWQCTGDHYWGATETALEMLKVTYTMYNNEAAAINAMRTGTSGADAKMVAFRQVADNYWATLADNGGSRPYAAGQIVLNGEITNVGVLAANNGWTVPGVANPNPNVANPCYQPWLPYNP